MRGSGRVLLVLLAAFVVVISGLPADVCVHDIVTRGYQAFKPRISPFKARRLAATQAQWRPMKIHWDYSGLETLDKQKKEFLINDLIPKASAFLSSYLSVKYIPGEKWAFGNKENICHKANVPARYRQPVIDADLLIFVTWGNETNSSYRAWAAACSLDSVNGRPKAGQIQYSWGTLKDSMTPAEFKAIFHTSVHELTHVLGLSKSRYASFLGPDGKPLGQDNVIKKVVKRGYNTSIITLPRIRDYVRSFFNCPTAEGAELENQGESGSLGSHWERRVFTNEFMTAASRKDHRVTNLTLILLESTGWYKVDYSVAGETTFGKGAGCGFLDLPCYVNGVPQYKGWCRDMNLEGCDHKHMAKSSCGFKPGKGVDDKNKTLPKAFDYFNGGIAHDHFCDNCPYIRPYSNGFCGIPENYNPKYSHLFDETYGPGSRCFEGDYFKASSGMRSVNNHGTCHKYRCQISNGKYYVQILVGNTPVNCPPQGGNATIPGYKGSVKCPVGADFCRDEKINTCPEKNYCSEIGHCYRGKCICPGGFETETCEAPVVDCGKANACNQNGACIKGKCLCQDGWGGANCSTPIATSLSKRCSNGICYGNSCFNTLGHLSQHLQSL